MVIEVIDNHGVTNMSAELTRSLTSCTSARLATASLTRDGMTAIENTLSPERGRFKVNLLVGLYNGHTEAAALRKLVTIQKRSGGSLEELLEILAFTGRCTTSPIRDVPSPTFARPISQEMVQVPKVNSTSDFRGVLATEPCGTLQKYSTELGARTPLL